ncbi:glycosyltransferase family 4 protein [Fervidicoccus fontis]|uniref:glycosyltransferase family 4 protein n=1 Tax=Fervidicoccus fontis TaxID=683846 RepID=UPI001D13B76A|nr:glycosyltransferase family 4 protein [Fervidicoccus fontis]
MRILFVSPSYYPHIGGVEYVVKSIAERLARMGHDIIILAGKPDSEKPYEEVVNEVNVIRWPVWSPSGAYHTPKMHSKLDKQLRDVLNYLDVVHVHSAHSIFSVYTGLAVKKLKPDIRLVFTPHYHGGGHSFTRNALWFLWRRRMSKLVEISSMVHAVSKPEASRILNHYPKANEKLVVIPNGIEEDVLEYKWIGKDSDYMIYAGRIEKYKNLEKAIEVARQLGLKLLLIGNGPYKKRLEAEAERTYPNAVAFKNFLPRAQYLDLLSKARYVINPSEREAFSIFIAEALAMGVPAIISRNIAENLDVNGSEMLEGLVVVEKGLVETWNNVLRKYLSIY